MWVLFVIIYIHEADPKLKEARLPKDTFATVLIGLI